MDQLSSSSSEYKREFQTFDTTAYQGSGKRLTTKSAPPADLPPVVLTYESSYDSFASSAKSTSRLGPVSTIAQQAANEAVTRTHKRRMSLAAGEAAAAAQRRAEEKAKEVPVTQMDEVMTRRFSLIANEAASVASQNNASKKNEVAAAAAPRESKGGAASIQLGNADMWNTSSWISEYDTGYQAPSYLKKMAKAAERAAVAAIQFKRDAGLCSEYLASYAEFQKSDMVLGSTKTLFGTQVGDCLDFTEAEAQNLVPSNFKFVARRVAWSSEYSAAFNDLDEEESTMSQGSTTERSRANSSGFQVSECMDWVPTALSSTPVGPAAPIVDQNSEEYVPPPMSMYSNDFQKFSVTRQESFAPSAVTEISSCMDWSASNAVTAANAAAIDTKTDDDWILVDRPAAEKLKKNQAVIPGWGSVKSKTQHVTTYDWDFDGVWKQFSRKRRAAAKQQSGAAGAGGLQAAAQSRQDKIQSLATQKGVAKQSASELFVAEKMLPFFATGTEYQKKYSVPAAIKQAAVNKVVNSQKKIASKIKKVNRPNTQNNPILRGSFKGLGPQINLTSYQSSYGNKRQSSLKARIRALAAADNQL